MATNGALSFSEAIEPPKQAEGIEMKTSTPKLAEKKTGNGLIDTHATGDFSAQARDLTSRILEFLSNASNETLGACLVGLAASTWLILGRVGLLLIGVGGGIVLHATWEGGSNDHADDDGKSQEARKRREKGLEIVGRVLDWRERTKTLEGSDRNEDTPKALDFSRFPPEAAKAATDLTDAVIRDYVRWWYGPLVPADDTFPRACRHTLTSFLLTITTHLSRKRPADTFLDFFTNSSSVIIVFLSELSNALRASGFPSDAAGAIHDFLRINPSSGLSNIIDKEQQDRKLRAISEDILRSFLEPNAYACEPVRFFLREVLAGVILDMTVTSCSRADFINDWIIYSLEVGSPELIEALDAGVGGISSEDGTQQTSQVKGDASHVNGLKTKLSNEHRRTVSRAEGAMEEAMQEAKRLSELIAAEEAKKEQVGNMTSSSEESTTAEHTPTSSRDDLSTSVEEHPSSNTSFDEAAVKHKPNSRESTRSFTTFDQIISSQQPTALQASQSYTVPPLTLHNASVSIFDDSGPNEKGTIRSKPIVDYLLQIEPATSQHPGWMIARKYSDFETLHEVLRRISVVSGVAAFTQKYQTLPAWKGQTKAKLRIDLEHYLREALAFQRLAESEGMKRFLEKDQALARASPGTSKGGFGFPSPAAFETMGKGMLDVLTSAPKGAAGGGKAILGGVTGVLGGVSSKGQKRQSTHSPAGRINSNPASRTSTSTLPVMDSNASSRSSLARERSSQESPRVSLSVVEDITPPPLPRRQTQDASTKQREQPATDSDLSGADQASTKIPQDPPSLPPLPPQDELHLPPPPSEIEDDYKAVSEPPSSAPRQSTAASVISQSEPLQIPQNKTANPTTSSPLNSQETSVAVELFFATINELYTLSSAWTLRLTLLNAAKSFLLRPGNPNLEAIRQLLQTTIIDAHTSDTGIATLINKVRQNAMPTEEERRSWPKELTPEEKETRRVKARKLLVEKGMPTALTSVMGQAASGEALGRVFDCLQVEEVSRGLIFALILQGVKAVTQ